MDVIDLIAATHGRSFWVLDDLSPLQQINDEVNNADVHLFKPANVRRFKELGRIGQDVGRNKKIYGREVAPQEILQGGFPVPASAKGPASGSPWHRRPRTRRSSRSTRTSI
mgnify:CR=1 FL=1